MGGEVVRARMGERSAYRPLESPLSPSSDPIAVLRRLRSNFPALEMWIDNGAADEAALEALAGLGAPVIGSESQRDGALVARHRDSRRVVLSLDFRGEAFQGPSGIL